MKVECTFKKSNSFITQQGKNTLILSHEQLHFDIGELFARKLRLEFANSKINVDNVEGQAETIFQKVQLEYNSFQRMFDIDTQHGTKAEKQSKWELKVAEELKSLEKYKTDNC